MLLIKELALITLFKLRVGVYKYTISCIYARKEWCCSYVMETHTKVSDLLSLR